MSRRPDLREERPVLPAERVEEIRAVLERVLSAHHFRGSRRCQSLLRHIIEKTLAGDTASLKERTLGIEVFGREADYDTNQDPVVRATAAETRKKLAQYYQEAGHESEPRIELPPGSYLAEFHFGVTVPEKPPKRKIYPLVAGGLALAVLVALSAWFMLNRAVPPSALEQLWAPVLEAPGTILICVGQPIVYNLKSIQAQDAIQGIVDPGAQAGGEEEVIHKKDLLILSDRYVDLGDAVSLARLTSLVERHRRPYRIRGERSTTFADLTEGSTVLIGAFNNQWTLRAVGQLRYSFVKDSARALDTVRDQQHPADTRWQLARVWPYWDVTHDYAIVSRVLDTTTNRPVIIAAGITQHGTMASGAFLTNPEYFAEAVKLLPSDWQKKNVQIVLQVPVVNRVAGRPHVLATHVW